MENSFRNFEKELKDIKYPIKTDLNNLEVISGIKAKSKKMMRFGNKKFIFIEDYMTGILQLIHIRENSNDGIIETIEKVKELYDKDLVKVRAIFFYHSNQQYELMQILNKKDERIENKNLKQNDLIK